MAAAGATAGVNWISGLSVPSSTASVRNQRPPVVGARLDQVDLVAALRAVRAGGAVFGGIQPVAAGLPGQALRIAVAVGIHR